MENLFFFIQKQEVGDKLIFKGFLRVDPNGRRHANHTAINTNAEFGTCTSTHQSIAFRDFSANIIDVCIHQPVRCGLGLSRAISLLFRESTETMILSAVREHGMLSEKLESYIHVFQNHSYIKSKL